MTDLVTVSSGRGVAAPGSLGPGAYGAELEAVTSGLAVQQSELGQLRAAAEQAQARAGTLLAALTAAEEAVRARLAAELHDGIAQSLARARVLLASVVATGLPPSAVEALEVAETVRDAEEQVRAVTARLRPPELREGDLAKAVVDLRDDLARRYGLEVDVDWPSEAVPLPLSVAVTVFRFISEALLNTVKHADVDTACLRLTVTSAEVLVEVSDEGEGFDPTQVRASLGRHVGLGLLRERARQARGTLEIESVAGAGTLLRLRLPAPGEPPPPLAERFASGAVSPSSR